MKKTLLNILWGGVIILSTSISAVGQTLTQDWKHTTNINEWTNARWAVGADGKIFVNDKGTKKIYCWDQNGKTEYGPGAAGTAITIDDAGNIIVSNGWAAAGAAINYQILPKGESTLKTLTVTMPGKATAGRMDYIGRAVGNVMSAEGGAFYIAAQNSPDIAKIFVAEGKQVADKSKSFALTSGTLCGTDGHIQPISTDPNKDEFVAKAARGLGTFSLYKDGTFKSLPKGKGQSTTAGGDAVILDGKLYTVNPSGTAYADGFIVCDETGKVLATHAQEGTAGTGSNVYANILTFEKVDEYTANIYQYFPSLVAKYTFKAGEPAKPNYDDAPTATTAINPASSANLNAFAYDITASKSGKNITVKYKLNSAATSVKVQAWKDGAMVQEIAGGTAAGQNEAVFNGMANGTYSFKVVTESAALSTVTKYNTQYSFYHPGGVAVDNDMNSPYFGRLYVTEAMPPKPTGYHSSGEEKGMGVYVFDPMLQPVKNAAGTFAFKGGQEFQSTFTNGKTAYDCHRIRLTDDGRLFVTGQNEKGIALWEADPKDMEADWTPVIKGTENTDTYEIETASGEFMAAPNVGFDVKGAGENLKILMLSANNKGISGSAVAGYRTDEYNLGTADTWNSTPSKNIAKLSKQFTVAHSTTNVAYDNEGGIWYANSRDTGLETQPTVVHINAAGEIDYKVITNFFYGGGGIAFNNDFTLLAIGLNSIDASTGCIGVYEVSKDTEGKHSLVEKYRFSAPEMGRNIKDIAWDNANNLYIVGNSGEKFQAYALPRENGTFTTVAPEAAAVEISEPIYVIGNVDGRGGWTPTTGTPLKYVGNDVYEGVAVIYNGNDFAITDALAENADQGGWDWVNSQRYGIEGMDLTANLGEEVALVKESEAKLISKIDNGWYKITVNKANSTIKFETYVPEQLRIIGDMYSDYYEINPWNTTTELLVADRQDGNTFEFTGMVMPKDATFIFTGVIDNGGDWDKINGIRFGAKSSNESDRAIGTNGQLPFHITGGDDNCKFLWTMENPKIEGVTITVNFDDMTISTGELSGVEENIAEAATVIGRDGYIEVINGGMATVYTLSGAKVAQGRNNIAVPAGLYIVTVDGKATKVIVK